jgi:hydrogenase-4 component F
MGVLWVAIESTTLCSAPLIYFHRHHRSLEAAWKYLMICSVGIALALLGNFFLAVAFGSGGRSGSLSLAFLTGGGATPQLVWLKMAFVFLLVGYGTKMGLAPMHTWLPDAHSEAPSVVSALLSGAVLNCAFLGILRMWQVLVAAGHADFARPLFIGFGLISMAVAAVFILGQTDYKRMLAYSSVEHMGILILGLGLGGAAVFGAMLHVVNHALTKAMLFLTAGGILAAYRTKSCSGVRGLARAMPVTGALWLAGFLAITGTPPFGVFVSKFAILRAAFAGGHVGVGVAAFAIMAIVFVGLAVTVLRMVQGVAPEGPEAVDRPREAVWAVAPPALLGLIVLVLGLWIPSWLERALNGAARLFGGGP